jgi:hypothetical protein
VRRSSVVSFLNVHKPEQVVYNLALEPTWRPEVRMTFDKDSTFARIIEEHLELKRKNSELDGDMPLERYRVDDPFDNHPLFKSEEQARVEDTLSGVDEIDPNKVLAWPTDDSPQPQDPEDTLWGRSRDFDWGD